MKTVWMVVFSLVLPVIASAQVVSPDRIAQIAKTVHDAEGWDLGASSTRGTRNEFWARVIGIVHWGHPVYNPTPDPSWCLKDGGGGRPQTDDVATQCVSRLFWDCIGGVGSNGYENNFRCAGHGSERLPAVQNVYPPPKPKDWTGGNPNPPPPVVAPPPPVDLSALVAALARIEAALGVLTAKTDTLAGVAVETRDAAKSAEHDAREINARPVPVLTVPCLTGRFPKTFGGSTTVTLCPLE